MVSAAAHMQNGNAKEALKAATKAAERFNQSTNQKAYKKVVDEALADVNQISASLERAVATLDSDSQWVEHHRLTMGMHALLQCLHNALEEEYNTSSSS